MLIVFAVAVIGGGGFVVVCEGIARLYKRWTGKPWVYWVGDDSDATPKAPPQTER